MFFFFPVRMMKPSRWMSLYGLWCCSCIYIFASLNMFSWRARWYSTSAPTVLRTVVHPTNTRQVQIQWEEQFNVIKGLYLTYKPGCWPLSWTSFLVKWWLLDLALVNTVLTSSGRVVLYFSISGFESVQIFPWSRWHTKRNMRLFTKEYARFRERTKDGEASFWN